MKKYLVIGNPIEHSLSPRLHNHWIKKNNIDAIYDKKQLNEGDIEGIISEVRNEKIYGINVTVPFKKLAISFIDELSVEANEAQSVNTIYKENNKIVNFERGIDFDSVKIKNKNNFVGYVYSGISIINSVLLKNKFENYINFEKEFYPRIIKKYKSNFESIKGFWHSIDNIKNINILKKNGNKKKYHEIQKILKKLKVFLYY